MHGEDSPEGRQVCDAFVSSPVSAFVSSPVSAAAKLSHQSSTLLPPPTAFFQVLLEAQAVSVSQSVSVGGVPPLHGRPRVGEGASCWSGWSQRDDVNGFAKPCQARLSHRAGPPLICFSL